MKAAVVSSPGAEPEYADFPEPVVADGSELAHLVAAGIHPVVRALASGRHYGSSDAWPMVPGVDAVAERMAAPRASVRLPPEGDPLQVAAGVNPGLSSWLPLRARVDETGEAGLGTVLVLGATGAAGTLAVQNATILGATRVAAAGRNRERLAKVAGSGAAPVALTGDRDTDATAISDALAGSTPELVLDFVWGPVAEATFAALSRRGFEGDAATIVHVEIGATGGEPAALPASLLRSRRYHLRGSRIGSVPLDRMLAEMPRYVELLASGRVSVPVRAVPLSRIAEAWHAGSDARAVVCP